jgi:hypothetical protein
LVFVVSPLSIQEKEQRLVSLESGLDTCLMSISRFSLRDKVTLRLLKLYFYIADVVEWSRALDIRLSD